MFAGYQYRIGEKRDGTPYVRTGGTEAITVFEFLEDETRTMMYAKPVYMYHFPNITAPDGSTRSFDNNPAVMVPHEFNDGCDGELLEPDPIMYPIGFDDTVVRIRCPLSWLRSQSEHQILVAGHGQAQLEGSVAPPSRCFGGHAKQYCQLH